MDISIHNARVVRVESAWAENQNCITLAIEAGDGTVDRLALFGLPASITDRMRAALADDDTRISDGTPVRRYAA